MCRMTEAGGRAGDKQTVQAAMATKTEQQAIPAVQRGGIKGAPSLAILPGSTILAIISLIQSPSDRNRVSQVCRAFRVCERQSRTTLCLRAIRSDIWFLPLCFSNVTDLDLTAIILLPSQAPFHLHTAELHRLSCAFPNLTSLRVPAASDACTRAIASQWPALRKLAFSRNPLPPALLPRLRTVLRHFRRLQVLSSDNLLIPSLAQGFPHRGCPALRALNLSSFLLTLDQELAFLALKCPNLESLCLTLHPGRLTGAGILALARACPTLATLSVCIVPGTDNHAAILSALAAACGELPSLSLDLSMDQVPALASGPRMERVQDMAIGLRSLVVLSTDAGMAGVAACPNLAELTFGSCEGLRDDHLVAIARSCKSLCTLRILHCLGITDRGLARMSRLSTSLTSLSLCYLRPRVSAILAAVRPLSSTVTALRVMGDSGVDSLAGLTSWPVLARLEITMAKELPAVVLLQEPWLVGCPKLQHLALMFQNWCPSSLHFLRNCPSLTSIALSFSESRSRQTTLEHLRDIALLPRLLALSVHVCSQEWLSREAGRWLARCPQLKALDMYWAPRDDAAFKGPKAGLQPFLLELLSLKTLRHVQIPCATSDEDDVKAFYKSIRLHTVSSLLKCAYNLKLQAPRGKSSKLTLVSSRILR